MLDGTLSKLNLGFSDCMGNPDLLFVHGGDGSMLLVVSTGSFVRCPLSVTIRVKLHGVRGFEC